jgi:hypothetical protein
MYLHQLGEYLAYFRGRRVTPVSAAQPQSGDREQAWAVIRRGLGLPGPVSHGDLVRLRPAGLAPIEGVVDYLSPSFLGVRTDDALYRFIYGLGGVVVVGHHLYTDADQQEAEAAWQSWLARLFTGEESAR